MEHQHSNSHNSPQHNSPQKAPWWKSPSGITAIFFIAIAGYLLLREHTAHIGNNWIWLIFLVCPLMHVFMHGGHDHGGHDSPHDEADNEAYQRGLEEGRKQSNDKHFH
tara:strand:+ start:8209 stop:8532 length:324 start_codon:yes stop_codon:yes gene_type:complete